MKIATTGFRADEYGKELLYDFPIHLNVANIWPLKIDSVISQQPRARYILPSYSVLSRQCR
jgi:hypothetical protein